MLAMLMLVMVQDVPGPPGDEAAPRPLTRQDCRKDSGEIVVCGSTIDTNRLRPIEQRPVSPMLPRASIALSEHAAVSADAEDRGEFHGPAAMLRLKIRF
ncbi:MAG: hypothetical protein V4574_03990 [Pseudomonadota bacterium]